MRQFTEANIDAEMFASFQEDEELFARKTKVNDPEINTSPFGNESSKGLNVEYWTKRLYQDKQKLNPKEEHSNALAGSGNPSDTESKPEENVFKKMTDWISDNPRKVLLAALLIGGGSYLLAKHIRRKYFNEEEYSSTARRRRKRLKANAEQSKEEISDTSDSSITVKEIAIGVAAAAGGALAGTVLNDYAVAAAVPVAAIGAVKSNIPLIAAAIGLVLSGAVRKAFQVFFDKNTERKDEEMKSKGYISTMLGYIKPSATRFSDA